MIDGLPTPQRARATSLPSDALTLFTRYLDPIARESTAASSSRTTLATTRRVLAAGSKLDRCTTAYRVTGGKGCTRGARGARGAIALQRKRTREGDEHERLMMELGGGEPPTALAPAHTTAGAEERLHDAVVDAIDERGPMSRNALERTVREGGGKVKRGPFLVAIGRWVDDPDDELALDERGLVTVLGSA